MSAVKVDALRGRSNHGDSGLWKHILLVVVLLSFTVLLAGGFWIYKEKAPIPTMLGTDHQPLVSKQDLLHGQQVFQKYDLMDYGSILGNGTFFGPDFTAETLHLVVVAMRDEKANEMYGNSYDKLTADRQAAVSQAVKSEIRVNRYDPATDTLTLTPAQSRALDQVRAYYNQLFTLGNPDRGLQPGSLNQASPEDIRSLADYFFWTAWLSAVNRPGLDYSYTNNWPYEPGAGNENTFHAVFWSAASVAFLILMLAFILWVYNHFKLQMQSAYDSSFPDLRPDREGITVSQRKTGKYFVVVCLVFLFQVLMGGLMAHYYVEGSGFYGLPIADWLPFNIAKTWHLQSAVFWIATAWLGMGLFIAPIVGGREPKGQGILVDVLFWALVAVVAGSFTGEWLGAKGLLGKFWFTFGNQGWNYLEMGRVWQVLLVAGLLIWLFIVWRGLRDSLRRETDKGGLVHLLFYSAWTIPGFYIFAFLVNPTTHITFSDYWRWWVIHLWVEGVFEVFAVVAIGFLLVTMGLVTRASTVRALYFQILILMGSGVIGTGHHYYWIGDPAMWLGLGACFSALEVVPLTLLAAEAYDQYRMLRDGGRVFPYKAPFWFLISTAVWNLVGAGVFGFLINLPVVSYYEHGSFLTATHGHTAMMGVYGMLAIALMLFSLRRLVPGAFWPEKLFKWAAWGLNLGLVGMALVTLFPVGVEQLRTTMEQGFWAARQLAFYRQPFVYTLLWARIVPDTVFIVVGVLPLALGVIRAFLHLKPVVPGANPAMPQGTDGSDEVNRGDRSPAPTATGAVSGR
ncbi:nitric-oxide reductase large subunit [Kyrpidia tusciae]|uniref:Nitric-oxide reductase n=1 Tax=Kyrpidia tusciae (strain DSM 2912 / NBRC 15312 / T2) TaxID=562970 RepID=D5WR65_KYRT2|nr:nitric-oxide reductase large subunit [Kyrpidia tusciae]ADG06795.1 Nitric-oxide reductase [Kyrpidia tusciae DSM 2912]